MHVQRRVSIEGSTQEVWDVITDPRSAKGWAVGFDDYPAISPDWPKNGARATFRYHAGPLRIRFELTVTESIAPKSLHIASRSVFGQGLEVYSLTFSGGVTTVWYDASDEPNLAGKLFALFFERRITKQIDQRMVRLKEYCETRRRQARRK
jgi:hypothetical protein